MLPPLQIFNAATSALFIVLGVLVARVKGGGPQNRAFAAFAIGLGAAFFIMNVWTKGVIEPPESTVEVVAMPAMAMLFLVAGASLLVLGVRLSRALGESRRSEIVVAATVGTVFFGLQVAVLFEPGTFQGAGWPVIAALGSVAFRTGLAAFWAAIAYLAIRFTRGSGAQPASLTQVALVSSAVVLWPAYFSGVQLLNDFSGIGGAHDALEWWSYLLAPLVTAILWLRAASVAEAPRAARSVAWTALGAMLLGMLTFALNPDESGDNYGFGVARLASIAILAYVIVQHQLLGIDVKVRWGISKSTVAAAFILVFFVASEVAQQFFGARFGSAYVGIAAAGMLVFAMAPLQRAAERLAEKAVPLAATPMTVAAGSAVQLYRKQVETAWTDGRISANERVMLRDLRKGLGIDAAAADEIEHEIESKRMMLEEG